jgi:hypothetical protein
MLAALAALLHASLAPQQRDSVQPYEVRSASGEWRAAIDPTSRRGEGPSNVRVERNGQLVWANQLPFTLVAARLSESGTLAGFGFTDGLPPMFPRGDLVVAAVDARGSIRLDDRTPLTSSRYPHGPAEPTPYGLLLDGSGEQLVLRVAADSGPQSECWWRYSLLDGKKLPTLDPMARLEARDELGWIECVAALPDAPLTLVEWRWRSDAAVELFPWRWVALLDDDGAAVWTMPLRVQPPARDRHFASTNEDEAPDMSEVSAILAPPVENTFELWHPDEFARVTYQVCPAVAANAWEVREITRRRAAVETAAKRKGGVSAETSAIDLALEVLGEVRLQVEERPVGWNTGIVGFEPQPTGTLRALRCRAPGEFEILRTDERGAVLQIVPVTGLPAEFEAEQWIALANDRWLAASELQGRDEREPWFLIDANGVAAAIDAFPAASKLKLAATQDGGFVALALLDGPDELALTLARFRADGARAWSLSKCILDTEPDGQPSEEASFNIFHDAADVTVGPSGRIYVLSDGFDRDFVCAFDADGQHRATIRLAFAGDKDVDEYERPSRWLRELLIEPSGAFLVNVGYDEHERWVRFDRDGRELAQIELHRQGASADFGHWSSFALDAQGVLWSSRADEILSYDATGLATTRHGSPPATNLLYRPLELHFDAHGRIVVVDDHSRAALAFGASGEFDQLIAAPAHELGDATAWDMRVHAGPGRRSLIQTGKYRDRWIELGEDGEFVAVRQLGGLLAEWLPDGSMWVADREWSDDLLLQRLAPDGQVLAQVDRGPQGVFFDDIQALGAGPNNAVAVLARIRREHVAALYDGQGQLLRSVALASEPKIMFYADSIAWRADWLLTGGANPKALLVSLRNGAQFRIASPCSDGSFAWSLSPDGREVWCARTEPLSVLRFALPE